MSDTPPTDREADDAAHAGREPRQGPPPSIDDAFREISDAGREGLSAALDTGRALRGLLIADFALARRAPGRARRWVSVAKNFGATC
ncbi:phage holin family protein, partial [Lysobacter sp. 2RAB21]